MRLMAHSYASYAGDNSRGGGRASVLTAVGRVVMSGSSGELPGGALAAVGIEAEPPPVASLETAGVVFSSAGAACGRLASLSSLSVGVIGFPRGSESESINVPLSTGLSSLSVGVIERERLRDRERDREVQDIMEGKACKGRAMLLLHCGAKIATGSPEEIATRKNMIIKKGVQLRNVNLVASSFEACCCDWFLIPSNPTRINRAARAEAGPEDHSSCPTANRGNALSLA